MDSSFSSSYNKSKILHPWPPILDTVPDWFWNLSSECVYLNLSHNQLSGTISNIRLTGDITTIDLHSNIFNGTLPRILSNVAQRDLSNNSFSGNI